MSGEPRRNLVRRLVDWLRTGYPHGIPQHDYIVLFGLLHRDLTTAEVEEIALALHQGSGGLDGNIPMERIRQLIRHTIHEKPSEADVQRVAARLSAAGWPLTSPPAP